MTVSETQKPQVYYNGACPVCRAGIESQRTVMGMCAADIEWVDIDKNLDTVQGLGATVEEVRERLYVKDERGHIYIGVEAFSVLWCRTPRQRWLASLIKLPVVGAISQGFYNLFARCLYRWNRKKGHW
jgi:predicted DCC family thiol-disulfide oxidoreductase YuxK